VTTEGNVAGMRPGKPLAGLAGLRVTNWNAARISLWIGVLIVGGFAILSFAAPFLPLADPYATDYGAALSAPSPAHLLGTDDVGRDLLSRVVYGAQTDLLLGFIGTYVPLVIGVLAGTVAGFYGGWRETLIMRFVDGSFAFPFIVLVLAIVAIVGPGLLGVYVGVIVASWPMYARLTHAEMRVLRERQFILAAKTLGFSDMRVIVHHAVPNLIRPSLVFSCSDLISNILVLASLSYLGVGVQPPTPEWGALVAGGQTYLLTAWWITTLPGLAVVLFGVGASLLGEGLAERWNAASGPRA
jgi:peptide/nickel transport system permease protein